MKCVSLRSLDWMEGSVLEIYPYRRPCVSLNTSGHKNAFVIKKFIDAIKRRKKLMQAKAIPMVSQDWANIVGTFRQKYPDSVQHI